MNVIDLSTPFSRRHTVRELVVRNCLRRGLSDCDDLTYRAKTFAVDCLERDRDTASRALRRTDEWLDAMVGPRRVQSRRAVPAGVES
jgi:hypothetical protein